MNNKNMTQSEWNTYRAYLASKADEIAERGLDIDNVNLASLENCSDVPQEEILSVAIATIDYYIDQGME